MLPGLAGYWLGVLDGDARAYAIYQRHYSARKYKTTRHRTLFAGPGEKMILMTLHCDALFVWRKFIDASGQQGVNCAVFRNESEYLSSTLINEAVGYAWIRWPGQRLYTYVNPKRIKSTNPGYCFKMAGWSQCGHTKKNLIILERLP